jgi:hypothetical protein
MRPPFTTFPAGIPDWIADPQPGFGYKMQTGFGMLRGYVADEPAKGQRRHWWPSYGAQLSPLDTPISEAEQARMYRLRRDFAASAPHVSLRAFSGAAVQAGARPHLPGDPVPVGAVRFAVAGVAVMLDCDFMWSHGLWIGTYRTDLQPACAVARDAVVRWWRPRHEHVIGCSVDGKVVASVVTVDRAAVDVYCHLINV